MKALLYIIFSIVLYGCAQHPGSDLLGVWKSNEEKTFDSINSIDGIPQKAMDYFNDNFFGHLIVEYKPSKARAYFDNCEKECEDQNCIETVCK